MTATDLRTRAALLLTLPVAGMIALLLSEVVIRLAETPFDSGSLPPIEMIIGVLCFSSVPVLLLSFLGGAVVRWISLGIVGLMTLFHAMHIVEHIGVGDMTMNALIGFTMFLPSLFGAILIWRAKGDA